MGALFKDNAAGEHLHFFDLLAELAVIAGRCSHFGELLGRQGDGHCLLRNFAGPLVTSAAPFAGAPILHRALADVTELAQTATQQRIVPLGRWILFHAHNLACLSRGVQYEYWTCGCTRLFFPPSTPRWRRWVPASPRPSARCAPTRSANSKSASVLGCPRLCSLKPLKKPTAATASTPSGAPSGACSGRLLTPWPPDGWSSVNSRLCSSWRAVPAFPKKTALIAAPRP